MYTLQYERYQVGKMRVIERKMLDAIRQGKSWTCSNTRVDVCGDSVRVYLFNNLICMIDNGLSGREMYVKTTYQSATTKSRLNAILREFCNTSIYQKDYIWYYSDNTYTNNARTFFI